MIKNEHNFFGKNISGIFTIPSGIITTDVSILKKAMVEIPEIGILTTKSISVEPKQGNKEPLIAQAGAFSFINAVGLSNPGADEFLKKLSGIEIPQDKFLLISIFGQDEKEFLAVAEKLKERADGFELNISCPHSDKYGQVVGQDANLVEKIIKSVASLGKPVFVKISPSLDIEKTVASAIRGGASGFTAINTKGPQPHLFDDYPVLSNKVGGVSGREILELGLDSVKEIRKLTDLPIIGCGGISTAEDVKRYQVAGANYFGVGSALAGLTAEEMKNYFKTLMNDLLAETNLAEALLKEKLNMEYRKYRIKQKIKLANDLFVLEFDDAIKAEPGQFVFAWLPAKGEKPFSVFDDDPFTLLIQSKGCFTKELEKLESGDVLYIRGPYGNSPKIERPTLLVGGGTGIAALYLFAKRNKNISVLLGARDSQRLLAERFKSVATDVQLFTDDGSAGEKGRVTDGIEKIMQKIPFAQCLNCGPEVMIRVAIEKENKYVKPEQIYSSIDFMTKCGIGLCGSCATSKGYRNCVDGTFFENSAI